MLSALGSRLIQPWRDTSRRVPSPAVLDRAVDTASIQSAPPARSSHRVRRLSVSTMMALATLVGAAAVPPGTFGPASPAVESVVHTVLPSAVTGALQRTPDPPALQGGLYVVNLDGSHPWLPDRTAPPSAVVNGRAVVLAEGIGEQSDHVAAWTHGTLVPVVGQPVLSVHEGQPASPPMEVVRIARDLVSLKVVEHGGTVDRAEVYAHDPAVKTLHDVIGGQLDAGHDVIVVAHSGGGAESALALNLLSQEGHRGQIGRHVRVLSMAGAAATQDYLDAGVHADNVMYTASHYDAIGVIGTTYVHDAGSAWKLATGMVSKVGQPNQHDYGQIFALNAAPDGSNAITTFLQGGPGGVHIR